jgi:hypothetical protein
MTNLLIAFLAGSAVSGVGNHYIFKQTWKESIGIYLVLVSLGIIARLVALAFGV